MAGDIFLKLDGIEGESTDKDHEKEIELLSWNWGVSQPMGSRSTGGSATTGKADHMDLSVEKLYDGSSPFLALNTCTGATIKEAVLTQRQADANGPVEAIKFFLSDVVISSVSISAGTEPTPVENVTLNYGKIRWEYNLTSAAGGGSGVKQAGFDVETNQKV